MFTSIAEGEKEKGSGFSSGDKERFMADKSLEEKGGGKGQFRV